MRSIFSDPQKLNHLRFRLPTIANFRLSDDGIPIWENLGDCNSSKSTTN